LTSVSLLAVLFRKIAFLPYTIHSVPNIHLSFSESETLCDRQLLPTYSPFCYFT